MMFPLAACEGTSQRELPGNTMHTSREQLANHLLANSAKTMTAHHAHVFNLNLANHTTASLKPN
jgi:hypothetical protein